MKRTVYYPEIFEMVEEAKTDEEKVSILHKFRKEKGFLDILILTYDPRISWLVTRAEIENLTYDHMDIPDYDLAPSTLFLEARRRLYNFTSWRQPALKKEKIIKLIAGMFSVLHHNETELFKQMVDGRIEELGMTDSLVRVAFPFLLHPVIEEKEEKEEKEEVPEEPKPVKEEEPIPVPDPVLNIIPEPEIDIPLEIVKTVSINTGPKPVKKRRNPGPKSKLDKHRKEIFQMLANSNTKVSISKKFKTSAGNLANWIKKNKPLDKKD